MSTSTDLRNSVVTRARALNWPVIVCNGFASVAGSEASFRARIATALDVELAAVDRQLDDAEAAAARRSEPPSLTAALPQLTDEEMRQVEAERVTRMEVAAEERARRLREEENLRLSRQGIR